ncbi:MAG: sulfurtransferase TusA family protein [Proteobacteria bacterium]|nr:sulfurtransferase TusA family protein [Pseudomonadota bacterium]MBU1687200.1 sulfurtransferase TusA family protein [Pseudomonadota bacterium]
MATDTLDARGLKCPQPTLKMTIVCSKMQKGDLLEVMADCPTFEQDIQSWALRMKKTILWVKKENGYVHCQVKL